MGTGRKPLGRHPVDGVAVTGTRRRRHPVLVAALATAALTVPASAAAGAEEPPLSEPPEALEEALDCPETFEARDREPVLLVHGTGAPARENFGWNLLPQLRAGGFDVCTVDLPTRALADIQVAAEYVVHAVRAIHGTSGLAVDVAGHSQGGLEPRWAMAWWPSTKELIDDVVTFASPHDGTSSADALCAGTACWPAVHQMRPGSDFLTALWDREDLGGVDATSLGSVMDELVQPPETIELPGAANVILQDVCPARPVTHVSIVADAVAYELTLDAFLTDGHADPSRMPADVCQRLWIDEASPAFLLDSDTASGYREGSWMDSEALTTVLTTEEPPLAPYAADDDEAAQAHDRGEDERDGSGDVARDNQRPSEQGVDADPTAGERTTARAPLPATGGSAAIVGAGLLAIDVVVHGNRTRAVWR